ncbi:1-aminocyclopropane-1-carboxylate oxidase [Grifola frondosa]|uniref:1-aminocyclopropane-1-carboxylate oxidase n=1 Tax=Grifola frondosa TaxID=5627 RepID=A0A1C7LNC7_GRIFR|nr:1-aminocyclopropane-1-carboxylate oxidase [Grifola frondosa]
MSSRSNGRVGWYINTPCGRHDDIPTHPLLVVDYQLIRAGDKDEISKLWKAATELGFWYLKNHGVDREVDEMFELGAETMRLPLEEKMKYEEGDDGFSFGYKPAGVNAVDDKGSTDATEFLNVSKDDALAWPKQAHRSYPSTVNARMQSTVIPFVQKSLAINHFFIDVLNNQLGLPEGALAKLHRAEEHSGCVARIIKADPPLVPFSEEKIHLSAHTDFGSLSFLHNRLGGLQVLAPGADRWQYVKPLPGHAICNIGDSLNIFSGGILRSNIHRVIPPPKDQAKFERWSVIYFTRPHNSVELPPAGKFDTGITEEAWLERRVRSTKLLYYKGAESWIAYRGTEDPELTARVGM